MSTDSTVDPLWQACLDEVEKIKQENPDLQSSYRSGSLTARDGAMSCVCKMAKGDGTSVVFFITARIDLRKRINVTTDRWIDSHERYWAEQIANRERAVVIGGVHYRIGEASRKGASRGHGGRRFWLRSIETGEVTETDNLWYQGTIPPMFRDALPDTHTFTTREDT